MGAADRPTTIWHWKSVRLEDVAGALDLVKAAPHLLSTSRVEDVKTDAPLYHPLLSAPRVSERVDAFEPRGVDQASASSRSIATGVEVEAHHGADGWTLVFRRPLEIEGELALLPGTTVQLACAAWNGSIGNHGADKSISIWQALEIGR